MRSNRCHRERNDHTLSTLDRMVFFFKSYKKYEKKRVSCYLCNSKFCCHHTQIGMKFKTTLHLSIDLFTLVKINHILFLFFHQTAIIFFRCYFINIIVCGNFISPRLCFTCHYHRRKKKHFNQLNHKYSPLIHKVSFSLKDISYT